MTNWWRRIAGRRIGSSKRSSPVQRPEPPEDKPVTPTLSRWRARLSSRLSKRIEVVSDRRWKGPVYINPRILAPSSPTLRSEDLIRITQGLALIVRANRPLPEGLEHMEKDLPSPWLPRLFRVLRSDLEAGLSLPDAMAARPRFFPADYVARVRAGYETGALADALEALAQDLTFEHERNAYVGGKLLYVGLLSVVVLVAAALTGIHTTPALVESLQDYGEPLRAPVEAGALWAGLGAGGLVAAVFGVAVLRCRPFSGPGRFLRRLLSRVLGPIPLVGPWLARQNLATASDITARLIEADAPLDEALGAAAKAPLDPRYAAVFGRMADHVRAGLSLTEAADAEHAVLPRSYRAFVACGERAGRLAETLRQTAAFYRTRNDKVARITWDVVLPCAILVLGGCVFATVYVVFGANMALIEAML